jgi:alcohol dehydrogenase
MIGVEADHRRPIRELAGEPIDCVLDLLPPMASASQVRAAALCSASGGREVRMGGVGRLGGVDLGLPYPWLMRDDITVRGKRI